MKMLKRHYVALEKVFCVEVAGRLPFYSRARVYAELVDIGLLQPDERVIGAGGRFPTRVVGYALTHAGRYAYGSDERTSEAADEKPQGQKGVYPYDDAC